MQPRTGRHVAWLAVLPVLLTASVALAHRPDQPPHQLFNMGDFKLESGEVTGHAAAGGAFPADVEFINRETAAFLDQVADGGKKLN